MVTISDLSSRRSDEFHALYRKRNGELAAWTGESAERIHELLFKKAGLGMYEDEPLPVDDTEKIKYRFRKFFRESASDVSVEDMKLLFKLQGDLRDELNEDIDPQNWLQLSGEEGK